MRGPTSARRDTDETDEIIDVDDIPMPTTGEDQEEEGVEREEPDARPDPFPGPGGGDDDLV